MTECLLLRFTSTDTVEWSVCGATAGGASPPRRGSLGELAGAAGGRPIVVLADGTRVLLTEVSVPSRNERTALAAIPFMLEDQLAAALEELSFSLGGSRRDLTRPVAVVARAWLESLLEPLRQAGLEPAAVLPDLLALPAEVDTWQVLIDGPAVMVRTGRCAGFAVERDQLEPVLRRRLGEGPAPARIACHYRRGQAEPAEFEWVGDAVEITRVPYPTSALEVMSVQYPDALPLNLIRDPRTGRAWSRSSRRRAWAAAAVLIASLVVHLGSTLYETQRMNAERERVAAESRSLFEATFPQVRRIVDMRIQAEQELRKLRERPSADSDFVEVMSVLGEVLRGDPDLELRLAGLNYREGIMDLRVTATAMRDVETYRNLLAKNAMQVEILSAEQRRDGGLSGRIRLRGQRP